ncbi:unnamed protein product [Arctogadus glacialis]
MCCKECAGGDEIKQGQSLLALEKQWHVSCFRCHTCSIALTGEYISKDGVPYCETHYHAQFGVKCETCCRYISGRVLEVRMEVRDRQRGKQEISGRIAWSYKQEGRTDQMERRACSRTACREMAFIK